MVIYIWESCLKSVYENTVMGSRNNWKLKLLTIVTIYILKPPLAYIYIYAYVDISSKGKSWIKYNNLPILI